MSRTGLILFVLGLAVSTLSSQSDEALFQGAWRTEYTAPDGQQATVVAIVMDGFIGEAEYRTDDGSFRWALAGSWELTDGQFALQFECHSSDSSLVGTTWKAPYRISKNTVQFEGDGRIWERIDDGNETPLASPWLITGRMRNGEMQRRTPGARKTMKILSGSRFQWLAYNTETREFRGSGGGTYSATDGNYIENIEFFSRDDSRVGATLPFQFEIIDGEWHHSGKSSKGDPIHEVWSRRLK